MNAGGSMQGASLVETATPARAVGASPLQQFALRSVLAIAVMAILGIGLLRRLRRRNEPGEPAEPPRADGRFGPWARHGDGDAARRRRARRRGR